MVNKLTTEIKSMDGILFEGKVLNNITFIIFDLHGNSNDHSLMEDIEDIERIVSEVKGYVVTMNHVTDIDYKKVPRSLIKGYEITNDFKHKVIRSALIDRGLSPSRRIIASGLDAIGGGNRIYTDSIEEAENFLRTGDKSDPL